MSPAPDFIRQSRSAIAFVLSFLWLCFWWMQGSSYGEERAEFGSEVPKSERVAILDMLARQMISNYEQIKTWRGCYDFVDATYWNDTNPSLRENQRDPNFPYDQLYSPVTLSAEIVAPLQLNNEKRRGYWFVLEGKIDFVFDSQSQREYVRMLRDPKTDFIDIATGVQVRQNRDPGSYYNIYAPDSVTELYTNRRIGPVAGHAIVDGVPAGRLVSVRPLKNAGSHSSTFDCRALFGGQRNGLVRKDPGFWPRLKMTSDVLSGKANGGQLDAETVRSRWDAIVKIYVSAGSEPIYTVALGDPSKHHFVVRFDSKSGYNWAWYANRDGEKTLDSKTATYRRFDGIFLPDSYEERRSYDTDPGAIVFIRRLKLANATLNGAVSDSDFSVDQFDLKYCDRMLDEIKDELHVYDDLMQKFVIAEKFSFDASRPRDR